MISITLGANSLIGCASDESAGLLNCSDFLYGCFGELELESSSDSSFIYFLSPELVLELGTAVLTIEPDLLI